LTRGGPGPRAASGIAEKTDFFFLVENERPCIALIRWEPVPFRRLDAGMSSIGPSTAPLSFRTSTVARIIDELRLYSVVQITAPPFCGKSSLAVLIGRQLQILDRRVMYFPLAQSIDLGPWLLDWSGMTMIDLLNQQEPTVLIFDDAHSIYDKFPWFWAAVKTHESQTTHPVRLLFLATIRKRGTLPSPFVFSFRLPSSLMLATEDDLLEMFDDYDRVVVTFGRPILGDDLRSVVRRLAGSHLGVIRFMLVQISIVRGHPDVQDDRAVVGYLLNERFASLLKGLRVTFDVKTLLPLERSILARCLDSPYSVSSSQNDERECCDHLMDLGLLVRAADEVTFSFASPILRRLILNALFSSSTRPLDPPASIVEFVKSALQMLKVQTFSSCTNAEALDSSKFL